MPPRFAFLRRDLGLQLFALYLFFVGPVVVGALVFDGFAGRQLREEARAADLDLASVTAQEIDKYIENTIYIVNQLAHYSAVINREQADTEGAFRTLTIGRSDISAIYLLDENCTLYFAHFPGMGVSRRAGFPPHMLEETPCTPPPAEPFVVSGYRSPLTEQPVVTIVHPVQSPTDQSFLGLIAVDIRLQTLNAMAKLAVEHRPEEGFQVYVVDAREQIIASSDFNPAVLLTEGQAWLPGDALSAPPGSLLAPGENGRETLYSYTPASAPGWQIVVSRPAANAFATPQFFHQILIIIIGIFLVVGLFFWATLSRLVIRPLEYMAAFSRTIGVEQTASPEQRRVLTAVSARPDQIGHLARSLLRTEQAIAARLNELSTLLETSAAVVSTLDPQTVLDRILEQVERLLNVRQCAIIALDEQQGVFRSRASRGLSRNYTEQLVFRPGEPSSLTMQALRSGTPIQIYDAETDPIAAGMRPRARQEGVRALLIVPLQTQHTSPAVLVAYHPEPRKFTAREINLVTNFANQAAMAIENATLFARSDMQLQEQSRRLEALIQSMQDGLMLEDLGGRVLYANRRMGGLANMPPEELIGAPMMQVMEQILARTRAPEKTRAAVQEALRQKGKLRAEIVLDTPEGPRYLRLRVFEVTDAHGLSIGLGQILQDITQRRELDRMKSSLISTVSHELRTPLAAIKGYATTLLAEDVEWDPVSQREFLTIISTETDRLSQLVNDLMDMSRIEAGNLSISRVDCDLRELVVQAAQRTYTQLGERLRVDISQDLAVIYADPQRIEVVLRNLIENAAKYSPEHAPIWVAAYRNGDDLVVQVADEGDGILPEHVPRVFERFYRVEDGLTRRAAGAGLGLAISKGFVGAHGGRIWVEPRRQGTCIAFSLPAGRGED